MSTDLECLRAERDALRAALTKIADLLDPNGLLTSDKKYVREVAIAALAVRGETP